MKNSFTWTTCKSPGPTFDNIHFYVYYWYRKTGRLVVVWRLDRQVIWLICCLLLRLPLLALLVSPSLGELRIVWDVSVEQSSQLVVSSGPAPAQMLLVTAHFLVPMTSTSNPQASWYEALSFFTSCQRPLFFSLSLSWVLWWVYSWMRAVAWWCPSTCRVKSQLECLPWTTRFLLYCLACSACLHSESHRIQM